MIFFSLFLKSSLVMVIFPDIFRFFNISKVISSVQGVLIVGNVQRHCASWSSAIW